MRPPASESENRTHGAKKIGPSQHSDFFNRIGQLQKSKMADEAAATRAISSPQIHLDRRYRMMASASSPMDWGAPA